jgi:energy-coupling factor transporter ATP-binding protein EcfA2
VDRMQALIARMLLVCLATLPPMAVIFGAWDWASRNFVVTALATVVYEVILYLTSVLSKVVRQVEAKLVARTSSRLDSWISRRTSSFEKYYREYLTSIHHDVDLKGISTFGAYSLAVNQVFVDLALVPTALHEASANPVHTSPGVTHPDRYRRSMWELLSMADVSRLAIVGPPGSGKTTLLKHIAGTLGGRGSELPRGHSCRGYLPFLIFLRDHSAQITADPRVTLAEVVRSDVAKLRVEEPAGWIENRLANGQCLVLLDGLDEVAKRDDRRKIVEWAEREMAANTGNTYVITSRPYGLRPNPPAGATVFEVQPFTERQMGEFLRRWYLATHVRQTGRNDVGVQLNAEKDAADLLERLRGNTQLYELGVNPLLLTMMAHVHHYRNVLPGSRAELYREVCQVLLGKRQEAKGLTSELSIDQKEAVLRNLALRMMRDGIQIVPAARADRMLRPVLQRVGTDDSGVNFLDAIETTSGLVVERDIGMHSFAHKTLQEYLAAVEIKEKAELELLLDSLGDEWWREVHLLYAAQSDASPLVLACLSDHRPSFEKLTLAMDLVSEAREVSPAVRDQLDRLLAVETRSPDDPWSLRVRAAHFSRTLRQVIRLREDVYAIARLMSEADFQLFLDSLGLFSLQYQASGWQNGVAARRVVKDEPVMGVEHEDAMAFANWINELTGSTWLYRLPSIEDRILQNDRIRALLDAGSCGTWTYEGSYVSGEGGQSSPAELQSLLGRVLTDFVKSVSKAGWQLMRPSEEQKTAKRDVTIQQLPIYVCIASCRSFFLAGGVGPSGIRDEERRLLSSESIDTSGLGPRIVAEFDKRSGATANLSLEQLRVLKNKIRSDADIARAAYFSGARGLKSVADVIDRGANLCDVALDRIQTKENRTVAFRHATAAFIAASFALGTVGLDTDSWHMGEEPESGLGVFLFETTETILDLLPALVFRYGRLEGMVPSRQAILLVRTAGPYAPTVAPILRRHRSEELDNYSTDKDGGTAPSSNPDAVDSDAEGKPA